MSLSVACHQWQIQDFPDGEFQPLSLNLKLIITARNEVGARLYFYTCLWFCSQRWGGIPACIAGGIPACFAGFQAYTQGGSWGVWSGGVFSRPTPRGCIPACTEADPPPQWLLLRVVRILLECILAWEKVFPMTSWKLKDRTKRGVPIPGDPLGSINGLWPVKMHLRIWDPGVCTLTVHFF